MQTRSKADLNIIRTAFGGGLSVHVLSDGSVDISYDMRDATISLSLDKRDAEFLRSVLAGE